MLLGHLQKKIENLYSAGIKCCANGQRYKKKNIRKSCGEVSFLYQSLQSVIVISNSFDFRDA